MILFMIKFCFLFKNYLKKIFSGVFEYYATYKLIIFHLQSLVCR